MSFAKSLDGLASWFRRHQEVIIPVGLGAVGLALMGALPIVQAIRGHAVVVYPSIGSDVGTFSADAQRAADALRSRGWTTTVIAVSSPSMLAATLNALKPISRLILVGHGTSAMFLRGALDLTPASLAAMLVSTLAPGAVIGLAGCRAGADTSEPDWGPNAYGPGGSTSFAGQLRDLLVRFRRTGVVLAHSSTGGTTANPSGRRFPLEAAQLGRPGLSGLDVDAGRFGAWQDSALRSAWIARFRAGYGDLWMTGA